jgi:TPR repeat protein
MRFVAFAFVVSVGLSAAAHAASPQEEIIGAMSSGRPDVARRLATPLAKRNEPFALYTLGFLDEQSGTDQGRKSAISYYRRAAALNHKGAMLRLAEMYRDGVGVERDLGQTRDWLERLAALGSVQADYELGLLHVSANDPQKAFERFVKVTQEAPSTDEHFALAAFQLGRLTIVRTDEWGQKFSETAFDAVLQSGVTTPVVIAAKEEVRRLRAQAAAAKPRGDGSPDDETCQRYGLKPSTAPYADCRVKLKVARDDAEARQRDYEARQAEYERRMAAYEREQKRSEGLALMELGFGMMAGGRRVAAPTALRAPDPPTPVESRFNISVNGGPMMHCIHRNTMLDCR